MLLWATSVSDASPPAVLVIASFTVMLPAWLFAPAVPVVTVTLVPALSAVVMLPVVRMPLLAVVVQFGLPVMFASGPVAWIVTLFGSSSHVPAIPFGALASTFPVALRICLP